MKDAPPPGFERFDIASPNLGFGGRCLTFFLPSTAVRQLRDEELRKEAQARAEQEAMQLEEEAADALKRGAAVTQNGAFGSPFKRPSKPRYLQFDPDQELAEARITAEAEVCPPGRHRVYSTVAPATMLSGVVQETGSQEDHRRVEAVYASLKTKGAFRAVANSLEADREDFSSFSELEVAHPHFVPVVRLVTDSLKLAASTGAPPRIPPILLVGGPGIGKTHFAKALACAIGTEISFVGFDAAHNHAMLLGSDRRWSGSTYGKVFQAVCLGEVANPVIVLDELDKANITLNGNPVAALHSLLEPVTSAQVTDVSLGLEFDASLVIWVATANRESAIADTLLSRFRVFHIERPAGLQAIQVAQAVLHDTVKRVAPEGFALPGRRIAVQLAHLTAREVLKATLDAVANAVSAGRASLRLDDFEPELVGVDPAGRTTWLH